MDQRTYDEIYNQTLAEIDSYSPKATVPKQVAPQFTNEEEYLRYLGVKPKETGLIKGTVKSLGRGAGGAISQFGKALEYDQNQQPDLVNKAGYYIDEFGNYVTNLINKPVAEEGSRKEAFFGAMESVIPSLAMSAPALVGGAIGSVAGPGGTAAGAGVGSLLSFPLMQQAAAQDAYETISKLRPDIPEEEKRAISAKSGYWEAGPEAATNIAESLIFNASPQGRAAKTVMDVATAVFRPGVKQFTKNVAQAAPLEMAGEFVTGAGQASTLKEAGVTPEADVIGAGLAGAESAAYMTPFIAGMGTGVSRIKGLILENSITKPIPVREDGTPESFKYAQREKAVAILDEQLAKTLDPEAYYEWTTTREEILANPSKGFDIFSNNLAEDSSEVIDTVKATDILSVSPEASMGTQQELPLREKKRVTPELIKRGIYARPDSPLNKVLEAGEDSFVLPQTKGYKAELQKLKNDASILGYDLNITETIGMGGTPLSKIQLIPKGGTQTVEGQPSLFDYVPPTVESDSQASDLLVTENLPATRTISPDQVISPVDKATAPLTMDIEDAEFIDLPDSVTNVPQELLTGETRTQIPQFGEFTPQPITEQVQGGIGQEPTITARESQQLVTENVKGLELKLRNKRYVQKLSDNELISIAGSDLQRILTPKSVANVQDELTRRNLQEQTGELFPQPEVSAPAQRPYRDIKGKMRSTGFKLQPGEDVRVEETEVQPELPLYADEQLALPLEEQTYDQKDTAGLPSTEQIREESKPTKPIKRASKRKVEPNRNVQKDEGKGTASTRVEVETKPYVVDSVKETIRSQEETPTKLRPITYESGIVGENRKLIQKRADVYQEIGEVSQSLENNELSPTDKSRLEDRLEDLQDQLDSLDEQIGRRTSDEAADKKAKVVRNADTFLLSFVPTLKQLENIFNESVYYTSDKFKSAIVVMRPSDFLTLASRGGEYLADRVKTYAEFDDAKLENTELPTLWVDDSGRVQGHEGRARMTLARNAYITSVPVLIRRKTGAWGKEEKFNTVFQDIPVPTKLYDESLGYTKRDIKDVIKIDRHTSPEQILSKLNKIAIGGSKLEKDITNKESINNILTNISKEHSNSAIKTIASILTKFNLTSEVEFVKDLKDDSGASVVGLFDPVTGKISLNSNHLSDTDMSAVFVHEALHSALNGAIGTKKNRVIVNRLLAIKEKAIKELKKQGIDTNKYYGLRPESHIEELVTEAFTDVALQEALSKVEIKESGIPFIKNLYDKFVDVVRQLLGIDSKYNSALKEVFTLGTALLDSEKSAINANPMAKKLEFEESYPQVMYLADKTFRERNWFKGLADAVETALPGAHKFFTYLFRDPMHVAEKMEKDGLQAGPLMTRFVGNSSKKTENRYAMQEDLVNAGKRGAFDEINKKLSALDEKQQAQFETLFVFGDMVNKWFTSIEEVKAIEHNGERLFKDISKDTFDLYTDMQNFAKSIFKISYEKTLQLGLKKQKKRVTKELAELLKFESWVESDADFNKLAAEIIKQGGTKDELVKEAMNNAQSTRAVLKRLRANFNDKQGYLPRIRKQGPYKVRIFTKGEDGKKQELYAGYFASDLIRNTFLDSFKASPKDHLGLNYKAGQEYEIEKSYVANQINTGYNFGGNIMATDSLIDDVIDRATRLGDMSEKEAEQLHRAMSARTAELILSMSASGQHKIARLKDYVVGFETNPIVAFDAYINGLAISFAKAEYVQDQLDLYNEIKDVDAKAAEYALDYLQVTTKSRSVADNRSARVRYLTTLYFMAGSLSASILNLTQNIILGVPKLSEITGSNKEAAKLIASYYKMVAPQIAKDMYSDLYRSQRDMAAKSHSLGVPESLPKGLKDLFTRYRKSGLNFDTQGMLAMGVNEDTLVEAGWKNFKHFADKLMLPFRGVEVANRESAFLASIHAIAKKEGINLEKLTEEQSEMLYARANSFVNSVHFMGSGNLPIYAQKSALLRTALALQSYGINFFNFFYNAMTSKDKQDYQTAAKVAGVMFLIGGASGAVPGSDELNKVLKMLLGYDVKLEAKNKLGKITTEDFANILVHGLPTVAGINVSNNINLRLPVISGFIGSQDLGVASMGAVGGVAQRLFKGLQYATDGQYGKAIGTASPEFFARMVRAYSDYQSGYTSAQGAPVYFEGQKLKPSLTEAAVRGLIGFKTTKEAQIADVRFTEYELKSTWQRKKTIAVNKYIKGDKSAITEFNDMLLDTPQANKLIKPIKMSDVVRAKSRKPVKQSTQFEQEYA